MKDEIYSLNSLDFEMDPKEGIDQRIERLTSSAMGQLSGGATCPPDYCPCNQDCPRDGCVDCYCYGLSDCVGFCWECGMECAPDSFTCPGMT